MESRPSMMIPAYNPSYSGGRDWESSQLKASLGKNLVVPLTQSLSWMWWYVPVVPAMQEATGRKITVQADPSEKCENLHEKQRM
jgi:hypothetical protein